MLEDIDPRKLDFHMSFIPQLVTLRVEVALQPIHVGFRRYRLVMIRNRHVSSSKGKSQLIESALRRRDRGESSSIEIVYKDGRARPIQPRRWTHGKLRADTAGGIRDFNWDRVEKVNFNTNLEQLPFGMRYYVSLEWNGKCRLRWAFEARNRRTVSS